MALPESTMPQPAQPRLRSTRRLRRDILETVLLIAVIYTLVNLSTARAIVDGPSMQPNLYTGHLLVVNRFAYYFSNPQRGDIVVLHSPRTDCQDKYGAPGCEDLIKRAIGLPGETVELQQGRVVINGVRIEEPYVQKFCETTSCDGKTWVLKEDEYFVLGDNRPMSHDSHAFGPISRKLIVGQAWLRYWPLKDAEVFPHPVYLPDAAR